MFGAGIFIPEFCLCRKRLHAPDFQRPEYGYFRGFERKSFRRVKCGLFGRFLA